MEIPFLLRGELCDVFFAGDAVKVRNSHERGRYHDRFDRNVHLGKELRPLKYGNAENAYNNRSGFEAPRRGHVPERYSRRSDENRWGRSGSRHSYRYALYEHKKSQTWRQKNKQVELDGVKSSTKSGVSDHKYVSRSLGLPSSTSNNDQMDQIHEKRSSGRKLASTIITPSRDEYAKDDNVTFRNKVSARAINFSPTENVVSNDQEDGQIIGALQDMDIRGSAIIVAPQQEAWMDCDVQSDDLLGDELKATEEMSSSHQVVQRSSDAVKRIKVKGSTSSKGTSRSKVPIGLPSKKAKFFRRGSPRKRHAVTVGLPPSGETDEHGQKRLSSWKKSRASSRRDDDSARRDAAEHRSRALKSKNSIKAGAGFVD
ncbi:hypothetical protein Bca101_091172 [Brassica carinata]